MENFMNFLLHLFHPMLRNKSLSEFFEDEMFYIARMRNVGREKAENCRIEK